MAATQARHTDPVVVTGLGAVTVFGDGCPALFAALRAGQTGIHALRDIPVARGKDRSAQIEDPQRSGPWRLREMAVDAAVEAVAQAGLTGCLGSGSGVVTGLYVATTGGDVRALEDRYDLFLAAREAGAVTDPADHAFLLDALRRYPLGALAAELSRRIGHDGPRWVTTNACASGTIAMAMALTAIRRGAVDRALVVGADELKASSYWGAERSGFIGHDLRPFHADRDGSVMGDGAGALVLERAQDAQARGVEAWGQLAGWGITCDRAPHPIIPPEDGMSNAEAIRLALADADVSPDEIDYFNAHGTGTPLIDRLETTSAKQALGEQARRMAMSSTKSLTGHLAAASPVIEAIATLYCLRQQWVHPTAGLDKIDLALDLDYVPLIGRDHRIRAAVSNSLGGGGTNAVLVLRALTQGAIPRPTGRAPEPDDVVVTGVGAVTRLGDGVAPLLSACGGERPPLRARPFSVLDHVEEEAGYHHLCGVAQLGFAAGAMAWRDAALRLPLDADAVRPDRVAVVVGTALGGLPALSESLCPHLMTDPGRITPNMALDHGPQLAATLLCRWAGTTGPMVTLASGTTAGLQAVEVATGLLAVGACDLAVVIGTDAVDEPVREAARLLAAGRADGESIRWEVAVGAGARVLERAAAARRRGAVAKAVVGGAASWAQPCGEQGEDDAHRADEALSRCVESVSRTPPDGPCLGYAVGCALPEPASFTVKPSPFDSRAVGRAFAAVPVLNAVAAVALLESEPGLSALVCAASHDGSAAALRLDAVKS